MFGTLQLGDVLRNKYRLERVIGQGGMATVVAAFHIHLEQRVAIKFLRPELVERGDAVERFLREARAASRLEDASIARVIDVDALVDGTPFIVMEYLEGEDLAEVSRKRGALPPAEAAGYVLQACAAVGEAHAAGIIHRDIKPSNLFLAVRRSGESAIKVLDFGISQIAGDTRITQTAAGMGSMEYMSPEQMQSAHNVDARTDIWSLGVTLYELTTAVSPFHAEGVGAVCAAVMTGTPVPPRRIRPEIPAGLEAAILRCLEKDPLRRFASVAELAAAIAPFAAPPPALRYSGAYQAVALPAPPPAPAPQVASQLPRAPESPSYLSPAAASQLPRPPEQSAPSYRAAPNITMLAEPPPVLSPAPPAPPPPAYAPQAPYPPAAPPKLSFLPEAPPIAPGPISSVPGSGAPASGAPTSVTRLSTGPGRPPFKVTPAVGAVIGASALLLVLVAFLIGAHGGSGGRVKPDRFTLRGDMLYDSQMRLAWQRRPGPGARDWAAAKAYCASAGGGLRLPEVSELMGLLDVLAVDPPLDPDGFQTTPVDVFWTSSKSPSADGAYLAVSFHDGTAHSTSVGDRNRVRCVR